jgi:hypothetical protein
MKKHLLVFAITFFCTLNLFSQSFTDGYYINLNGDTIKCKLFFKKGTITPQKVSVLTGTDHKELTTQEISGFGIPGKYYFIKKEVSIHTNPINHRTAPIEFSDEIVKQTVFIEIIESGAVFLYKYENNERVYFLISESADINGKPEELVYRVKFFQTTVTQDSKFRSQLSKLIEKYNLLNKVGAKINIIEYRQDAISKIIEMINLKEGSPAFSKKRDLVSFQISAGLNITDFQGAFTSPNAPSGLGFNPNQFNIQNQLSYAISFLSDIRLSDRKNSLSLRTAIVFHKGKFNQSNFDSISSGSNRYIRNELFRSNQNILNFSIGPLYSIPVSQNASVSFFTGINVRLPIKDAYVINETYLKEISGSFISQFYPFDSERFYSKETVAAPVAGLGFLYKRHCINASFIFPGNIQDKMSKLQFKLSNLIFTYGFMLK